jgi:hypothetical protein
MLDGLDQSTSYSDGISEPVNMRDVRLEGKTQHKQAKTCHDTTDIIHPTGTSKASAHHFACFLCMGGNHGV